MVAVPAVVTPMVAVVLVKQVRLALLETMEAVAVTE
jgi:hypothetical protein